MMKDIAALLGAKVEIAAARHRIDALTWRVTVTITQTALEIWSVEATIAPLGNGMTIVARFRNFPIFDLFFHCLFLAYFWISQLHDLIC